MTERPRQASAQANAINTAESSFTRSGNAWCEVTSLGDAFYRIRLGGMLRASWMISVCSALAEARISIERAHARRLSHDGTWIAELHVTALEGSTDPMQLPLIAIAERSLQEPLHTESLHTEPLVLREYELTPSNDHGGTLHLTLTARDSVGLLGSLLAAFASLSLLPVEMHIETRGSQAHDALWLAHSQHGEHGETGALHQTAAPDDGYFHALNRLLSSSVQH